MSCSPDTSKTSMIVYTAESPMFRKKAWCLKWLCYRDSAVISQILLSVTSEEHSDRCWECKSLAKAFCCFVLNPDVTYQPGLPGSRVMGQCTPAQERCRQSPPDLTTEFKVLDPYHIYLFTIAMAGTSTTGVPRKGVRGTEGVLSIYWHKTLCEVCRVTAGSVLMWPHILICFLQDMF